MHQLVRDLEFHSFNVVHTGQLFIQGSCLFRAVVYSGQLFIQGSGLFRAVVYSGQQSSR